MEEEGQKGVRQASEFLAAQLRLKSNICGARRERPGNHWQPADKGLRADGETAKCLCCTLMQLAGTTERRESSTSVGTNGWKGQIVP
jgi:hypothetical protein